MRTPSPTTEEIAVQRVKRAYALGLKAVPNFTALSDAQLAYYEEHLDELPSAIARGFVVPGKFGLLADLGIITVPADYVLVTEFTGMNFPNPTRVLKPGDQLWVRAHKQIVRGTTTSEERLALLATLNSHLVGAQGIEIVEPKRSQLPKGYWYSSFDEKERLPLDAGRRRRVPGVNRRFDRGFDRDLGRFEDVWDVSVAILSFCDPALRPLDA